MTTDSEYATNLADLWLSNEYGSYKAGLYAAKMNEDSPEDAGRALVALLRAGVTVDENMASDFTDRETGESIIPDIDLEELGRLWIIMVEDHERHGDIIR